MKFMKDLFTWLLSYCKVFVDSFTPQTNGVWWIKSETDPRWNIEGRGFVGGLDIPAECEATLDELSVLYGAPPSDIQWDRKYD